MRATEIMVVIKHLTFPLGESLVAGYINIPPYFNVLWTSATIDPTYLAPYGFPYCKQKKSYNVIIKKTLFLKKLQILNQFFRNFFNGEILYTLLLDKNLHIYTLAKISGIIARKTFLTELVDRQGMF